MQMGYFEISYKGSLSKVKTSGQAELSPPNTAGRSSMEPSIIYHRKVLLGALGRSETI